HSCELSNLLPGALLQHALNLHSVRTAIRAGHFDRALKRLPIDRMEVVIVLVNEHRRHQNPRSPCARNTMQGSPSSSPPSAFGCGGRDEAAAIACEAHGWRRCGC